MVRELSDDERVMLGAVVRRAREAAEMTIAQASTKAPMSPVTWGNVELGRPVKRLTYRGIERSLGWASGSIDDVPFDVSETETEVLRRFAGTGDDGSVDRTALRHPELGKIEHPSDIAVWRLDDGLVSENQKVEWIFELRAKRERAAQRGQRAS